MPNKPEASLLGSNDQAVTLGPRPVECEIQLALDALRDFAASFTRDAMAPDTAGEPDRLFLKFRNIRGEQGSCAFDVSIAVPGGTAPPALVGSLALFGLEYASDPKSEHGGSGLTRTLEISEEVDPQLPELKAAGRLTVIFRPRDTVGPEDRVVVGKIDLLRLSAA